MSKHDHAHDSNSDSPNTFKAHEDESRRDHDAHVDERRKPGGPHFPTPEQPDPEPEKSGLNQR